MITILFFWFIKAFLIFALAVWGLYFLVYLLTGSMNMVERIAIFADKVIKKIRDRR